MAEQNEQHQDQQQQPTGLLSLYPGPPPFFRHFTAENLERFKHFKEEAGVDTKDAGPSLELSASQLLNLPPELRFLMPPEPPADDEDFRVFNIPTKIDRSIGQLPEGQERLIPFAPSPADDTSSQSEWTLDRAFHLKRMVRSLLLKFLELVGAQTADPNAWLDESKDLAAIVANFQTLVNEYRPHQARETLINKMEDQLKRKKAEVEGIKRMKEKIEEALKGFGEGVPEEEEDAVVEEGPMSVEEKVGKVQQQTWLAMDEVLGH